jgi:hypothetical protein
MASALVADSKGKKSSIIHNLLWIEDKSTFAKLGHITKKNENLSITSIKVNNNGVQQELSNKKEIEEAIIKENKHKNNN